MAGNTVLGEMIQYHLHLKDNQPVLGHFRKFWSNSKMNATGMKRLYMKWLDLVNYPHSLR